MPIELRCDREKDALYGTMKGRILNLPADLQDEYNLAYLFISHDLSVVHHIADKVIVMYLGRKKERIMLRGELPSPIDPPSGCAFHPRCPEVMDICRTSAPEIRDIGPCKVACHAVTD